MNGSPRTTRLDTAQAGMPTYGLDRDFPLLWEQVQKFDFAERLGGCTDPLLAEADEALRELWNARRFASQQGETWMGNQ